MSIQSVRRDEMLRCSKREHIYKKKINLRYVTFSLQRSKLSVLCLPVAETGRNFGPRIPPRAYWNLLKKKMSIIIILTRLHQCELITF